MKTKRNNNSLNYGDWTTAKLKNEYQGYHDLIYVSECYGMSDMRMMMGIEEELDERGVSITSEITFD